MLWFINNQHIRKDNFIMSYKNGKKIVIEKEKAKNLGYEIEIH